MITPRLCVVGAAGFIGRNLVASLACHPTPQSVRAVVRRSTTEFFAGLPQVDVQVAGLDDSDALVRAVADSDVVYHLASSSVPSTSNANPHRDIEVNLQGSLRLLDACRQAGVRRVVFISSGGTVYGQLQQSPVPEDHPTFPICSYGIVKLAIERYLHLYKVLHGLDYTILRVSNPYGPFQSTTGLQGAVQVFVSKLLRRESIEIWGDGSVVRDFLHVDDLVRALQLSAQMPEGMSGIYNVGSGHGTSLNELLEALTRVSGLSNTRVYRPSRPYDVPRSVLDITKIGAELDWKPLVSLEDGLGRTVAWLRQQHLQQTQQPKS